jgi:hypothetical protein
LLGSAPPLLDSSAGTYRSEPHAMQIVRSNPPSPYRLLSLTARDTRKVGFTMQRATGTERVAIDSEQAIRAERNAFPSNKRPRVSQVFLVRMTTLSSRLPPPDGVPLLCWGVLVMTHISGLHGVISQAHGRSWTLVLIDARTGAFHFAFTGKSVLRTMPLAASRTP